MLHAAAAMLTFQYVALATGAFEAGRRARSSAGLLKSDAQGT
jgi:hypothetical protein